MAQTNTDRKLLSVEQAVEKILAQASPLGTRRVALPEAVGHVLAEPAVADLDSPPFDKSLVDGYALRFEDVAQGVKRYQVVGRVCAGETYRGQVGTGQAVRILTGAPIPPGTDVVVMQEDVEQRGDEIELQHLPDDRYRFILRRGATMQAGTIVLRRGTLLKPAHIAVLAECGVAEPAVYVKPTVSVVTTGDELVPPTARPAPGAIRNSNGPMLVSAVRTSGFEPVGSWHARDDETELSRTLQEALAASDVLLITGGVSVGDRDYVPRVLQSLGVEPVFHGVHVRPGKPLFFGVRRAEKASYVFGLPGNPVSSLVGFLLFVRPLLRALSGLPPGMPAHAPARLVSGWRNRCDRPTYWPASIWYEADGLKARPLAWQGSPDVCCVSQADGFVFFPAGEYQLPQGASVRVLTLE